MRLASGESGVRSGVPVGARALAGVEGDGLGGGELSGGPGDSLSNKKRVSEIRMKSSDDERAYMSSEVKDQILLERSRLRKE